MALWMVHLVLLVLTAIVETSLSQKSGKSIQVKFNYCLQMQDGCMLSITVHARAHRMQSTWAY